MPLLNLVRNCFKKIWPQKGFFYCNLVLRKFIFATWWFGPEKMLNYLVMVKCPFFVTGAVLGEGQVALFVAGAVLVVEFGKIAGARNFVFCNRNYSSGARKVTSVARRVAD